MYRLFNLIFWFFFYLIFFSVSNIERTTCPVVAHSNIMNTLCHNEVVFIALVVFFFHIVYLCVAFIIINRFSWLNGFDDSALQ